MTDEQNRNQDAPEVEGHLKRFLPDPVAEVEGHGTASAKATEEADAEATTDQGGREKDEPEVEGHAKRFH